ncbi:hypothetical protein [Methylobacterium sp. J-076]|uniref:hypothetical protein n=1 Tax=Methylobacterium sp. J-076 TaxID=2836655 RepID=UPI001FB9BB47|nr:hypothetical protein [Methylobacterium sp. J-076]MCJ2014386.1 hypothetical protein [Methylobacterium sp. J-076]
MSGLPSAHAIDAGEYAAIESTIGASERGQRFLVEHARRARTGEMQTVLTAIEQLERAVTVDRAAEAVGNLRGDLVEMAEAISRTKAEITAISVPGADQTRLATASQALDAIVRATEQATSDILGAAEAVQEAAWTLRERNVEPETCEALDRHATAIYTACSFQDLTAQRTARIIYTLRYLEDRITAMMAIWGGEIARIPPPPEAGGGAKPSEEDLCQLDVDRYIAMTVPAMTAAAIVAQPGSPALHEDIVFVPVSPPAGTDTVQGPAQGLAQGPAQGLAQAPLTDAPAPEAAAEPAWTAEVETDPLFEFALEEPEAMSLAGLDAETPERRLALFA